ncbi:MAG: aminomethyl-transferring glycine dehydrogenase subunit GcvPB [Thermoplasmata archaeon]|nr:aminomethyl-transferring glycine dehydrogenase subunit GcvPB [Thermoplasmata archaeon]
MYRQARFAEKLIFEYRDTEARPKLEVDFPFPQELLRTAPPQIPDVTEAEVMRHFVRLSEMNYGVDTGFYPLGSCTMKYNRKICERFAKHEAVTLLHPLQPEDTVQGALQIMYELQEMLCRIADMDAVSLQPVAGAHGEFTGMCIVREYFRDRGERRNDVIVPDTAHGTNPASAAMAGFNVIEIPSKEGCVDIDALKTALSENTAAFMITNPNTLGIFEKNILEIARAVHGAGALLYYDGANLNAIMGKTSPGKMNFDIVHFNLHKTFGTPHGGGGPGAGAVGVKAFLEPYLPVPRVVKEGDRFRLSYDFPKSIGKVSEFYGNFGVMVRAYVYIKLHGSDGLTEVTERAVLNSNYMAAKLSKLLPMPYEKLRKHEFVLSGADLKKKGLKTTDLAKRLLDYGFHAPTVYFPHLVEEAIMIEPTETESRDEIDRFCEALASILNEPPELVRTAPHNTAVKRVDEVLAAKRAIVSYKMMRD